MSTHQCGDGKSTCTRCEHTVKYVGPVQKAKAVMAIVNPWLFCAVCGSQHPCPKHPHGPVPLISEHHFTPSTTAHMGSYGRVT